MEEHHILARSRGPSGLFPYTTLFLIQAFTEPPPQVAPSAMAGGLPHQPLVRKVSFGLPTGQSDEAFSQCGFPLPHDSRLCQSNRELIGSSPMSLHGQLQ